MNSVVNGAGSRVSLDAESQVHVVGVGPVQQVEAGDVALVLVVVLSTALWSLKISAVTLDLRYP